MVILDRIPEHICITKLPTALLFDDIYISSQLHEPITPVIQRNYFLDTANYPPIIFTCQYIRLQ